jgi:cytochrome c2
MKRNILVATLAAATLALAGPALAGDAKAGKAKAEACADCHEPADFAGEDAAALEQAIKDIVAGKVKHKDKLDPKAAADAADIAAYWASGG